MVESFAVIEEGRLGQLLAFVTGLDVVPPLGFEPIPALEFNHPGDADYAYLEGVPFANTCANSLRLPVLPEYQVFKERMVAALAVGEIFTDA